MIVFNIPLLCRPKICSFSTLIAFWRRAMTLFSSGLLEWSSSVNDFLENCRSSESHLLKHDPDY
jgi:hypothetical protein